MKNLIAGGAFFFCGLAIAGDSGAWSGPYVGLLAADTRLVVQSDATAQRGPIGVGVAALQTSNALAESMTYSDTARTQRVKPGVYAGYLWNHGALVYGVEADLQDGTKSRSSGSNLTQLQNYPNNAGLYEYDQTFNLHYMATLRGRFGYAQDNWLLYLTAGVAHAKLSTELNSYSELTGPTAPPPIFLSSTTRSSANRTGWVAGLGGEVAVAPQLRIRAEYLYYDLGETHVDSDSTILHNHGALYSSAKGRVKSDWTSSSARIGLTYTF